MTHPLTQKLVLDFRYNIDNDGSEGGNPGVHPAFASGQDGFEASLETKGDFLFSRLIFISIQTVIT